MITPQKMQSMHVLVLSCEKYSTMIVIFSNIIIIKIQII